MFCGGHMRRGVLGRSIAPPSPPFPQSWVEPPRKNHTNLVSLDTQYIYFQISARGSTISPYRQGPNAFTPWVTPPLVTMPLHISLPGCCSDSQSSCVPRVCLNIIRHHTSLNREGYVTHWANRRL